MIDNLMGFKHCQYLGSKGYNHFQGGNSGDFQEGFYLDEV